ncbi:MAG TPA: DUF6789 family protein [Steroidobacteraceae bacterium]|jgi:hypothetical protein|nr:DUF6789 family protein [Steroidobacteraceae bacterium]
MKSLQTSSLGRGLAAGLVATIVLTIVLMLKQAAGLMPQLDLVVVLAHALGSRSLAVGWAANAVVGVFLWGSVFVWADRRMFFAHWVNGFFFASVVWLGVMLVIMPAAGEGLFGMDLGMATPTLTLFLHWVYGVALGSAYGALKPGVWRRVVANRLHHA